MEPSILAQNDAPEPPRIKRLTIYTLIVVASLCTAGACFVQSASLMDVAINLYSYPNPIQSLLEKDSVQLARQITRAQRRISDLERSIDGLTPAQPYLIVNTTTNTFVLRTRNRIIREGLCSTGSYTLLEAGEDKQWMFKTPKGMFRIQSKLVNPLWVKPDWAFIEEGLPVPPRNHPDRFEYGTLGDYALSLGQGYLIHGTLYQRYLGLPVTHGCIRMGDEDLKEVFNKLDLGSRVYIF